MNSIEEEDNINIIEFTIDLVEKNWPDKEPAGKTRRDKTPNLQISFIDVDTGKFSTHLNRSTALNTLLTEIQTNVSSKIKLISDREPRNSWQNRRMMFLSS